MNQYYTIQDVIKNGMLAQFGIVRESQLRRLLRAGIIKSELTHRPVGRPAFLISDSELQSFCFSAREKLGELTLKKLRDKQNVRRTNQAI